jgi:PAS domain S-box-containing protein
LPDLEAEAAGTDELAEINRRLGMAVEATRRLASCRTEDELCRCLLTELGRIASADGGSVYLSRGDRLWLAHSLDPGHASEYLAEASDRSSIVGHAIAGRVPLLMPDLASDGEYAGSGWAGYRGGSFLVLPLLDSDESALGALCLHSPRRPPFTAQDLDLGLLLSSVGVEVLRSLQAAEALRKSEERFRSLIENGSDLVCVVDPDGTITYVAPSVKHILGCDPEAIVGSHVADAADPRQHEQILLLLAELERNPGLTRSVALRVRHSDGSWRVLESLAKSALGEPAVRGIVVNARDVTEQEEARRREMEQEEQLLQAAKLASLGTLVSGIAHEINNPNNYIRVNADSLRELWEDVEHVLDAVDRTSGVSLKGIPYTEARSMAREMLGGLREGSERIERLVGSLRDYARRREAEVMQPVDVNKAVEGALTIVANLVRRATARFTLRRAEDLPPVLGSMHQIEQVVINLVSNACQALPSASAALSVETRCDPGTREVMVSVSDEGSGIAPENIERIMEPFFTTKRETGGMGLGLSICDRIARNHAGRIEVTSTVGAGTTVVLALPVAGARGRAVRGSSAHNQRPSTQADEDHA